ncbi:hypothetical protein JMJ94_10370 [Rhodovulum visakhapatnamense]|uniref:hypothetical protein n=1 Tax=Rhodovulum visakhapatnamense TaxID=364297 RepID=UPI00192369D9|nr:hypothetical protein [Rhodovulum visakhapatnamense]MBL3569899.1 hypothetical protein [Rhodovulum visakhapatnamense]
MTPRTAEDLQAAANAQAQAALAWADAIGLMRVTYDSIRGRGTAVELELTEAALILRLPRTDLATEPDRVEYAIKIPAEPDLSKIPEAIRGGGAIAPTEDLNQGDGAAVAEVKEQPTADEAPREPSASEQGWPTCAAGVACDPAKAGSPWSEAEEAEALAMRARGCTVRQVARHLGRPMAATSAKFGQMRKRGRSAPNPDPDTAPPTAAKLSQVAAHLSLEERNRRMESAVANLEARRRKSRAPSPKPEPAPAAAPAAVAPPPPATSSQDSGTVPPPPCSAREVEAHLNAVGYLAPWTPQADLALVLALVRGDGLSAAATAAGVDRDAAKQRWHVLCPPPVTLDRQQALLTALRRRAEGAT